jgi:formylglycine-generating enzyme required for sulfatase activity
MAYKPDFLFSGGPSYASNAVPSLEEWRNLWSLWSMITTDMIPKEELLAKPIKLRNACIFYIGHIPTFLDLHISKALGVFSEELGYYQKIFERGIDPDVDNPQLCHAHSEIPDDWPPVDAIRAYQEKVRQRVAGLFESGEAVNNPAVRKALWLGFEHEVMHLETLLYMLIQSDRTKAPAGVVAPDFEALADDAKAVKNEWVKIPAQQFVTGLDDPDGEPSTTRYYGWDNEKPPRLVETQPFLAKSRPITNREYAEYLENTDSPNIPAGWVEVPTPRVSYHANGYTNGSLLEDFVANKAVRTLFGRVPLRLALDWPVAASYDELAGCAAWMGGRIPTAEEAKAIYRHADRLEADVPARTETVGAVNSHLVNDGVEETPPAGHANGHAGAAGLFADLSDANVGFKAWHSVAAGPGLAGRAGMGGVWEWTSTVLEQHAGFEPMALYPGYTGELCPWTGSETEMCAADFFDGKHNVVLGGSWATHPRIAGRKSLYVCWFDRVHANGRSVNWYQRNYPYVWAGARLVKDVD